MAGTALRIGLVLAAALAIAGCNEKSMNYSDLSPKTEKRLTPEIRQKMQAKSMKLDSPIMARIFKEEGKVEIWKQKTNGRYDVIAEYDICKYSGKLGPKFTEGDRQAPEGFYIVRPAQMKPNSQYHLAFNIGYPNAYDRAHGRTGSNIMVHGACSSSGCFSMTDEQMEQIYAFGREAFKGGQTEFQIQSFPFRMTAENMARYKDDPNYAFWKNLKEGYDHFEITKVPPKVDVCDKRYVFNQQGGADVRFDPKGACPQTTQPDSLRMAYQSYQTRFDTAFSAALGKSAAGTAKPTIRGMQEASLVSEWSRKRARGERVPAEPPTLQADGSVVNTTTVMVRANNEAGRKLAALEAAEEAKKKAAELAARKVAEQKAAEEAAKLAAAQEAEVAKAEKAAAKAAAAAANNAEGQQTASADQATSTDQAVPADQTVAVAPAAAPAEPESRVGAMKRKLLGMFGG